MDSKHIPSCTSNLQVMYYKCVKFHKNPISGLGGVALTRYMDGRTYGRTDGRTDRVIPIYPPNFVCGGYNYAIIDYTLLQSASIVIFRNGIFHWPVKRINLILWLCLHRYI